VGTTCNRLYPASLAYNKRHAMGRRLACYWRHAKAASPVSGPFHHGFVGHGPEPHVATMERMVRPPSMKVSCKE